MICSACAYRVRKALEGVAGVKQATVSIADKSAVVIYDDARADVTALIAASAKIGFPAAVKKQN
jgi:mercuric ion binding protein